MNGRAGLLFAVLVVLSCTAESATESDSTGAFRDLAGVSRRPLDVVDAKAHVLLFITTDCPIANAYAPVLSALFEEFAARPVRFFLIHVDPALTEEAARRHAGEFGLAAPVLIDRRHELVRAAGATITPEVAVLLPDGELAYRGRIDDQWGDLGRKRPSATRHDLRDALASVLADRPVATPRTTPVGCDLPPLPERAGR